MAILLSCLLTMASTSKSKIEGSQSHCSALIIGFIQTGIPSNHRHLSCFFMSEQRSWAFGAINISWLRCSRDLLHISKSISKEGREGGVS